jgi:hypothetical protein
MSAPEQQTRTSWLWRSRWAAIGAALTVAVGGGGLFVANAATGPASTVVTIDPVRILDTRDPLNVGLAGPFVSAVSQKLQVTGPVPTTNGTQTAVPIGATGVLLNVTVVGPTANGFLSVRPGDATGAPSTSSLNFDAGDIVPNSVQVGLPTVGANAGQIDITYDAFGTAGPRTDVLVDVVGYTTQLDAYTKAQTDAAIAGSVQQTITAGGASGAFTFPTVQLTLGQQTITTAKAGHLELHFVGAGGLSCTSSSSYNGWIEVDGVPVRSSLVSIGENFDVPGADVFSATSFSQKVLHGVTATPVPAGAHQVRARFGCTSGAGLFSSSSSNSWIVTVLSGTPSVAALELTTPESADAREMCMVDADGVETCTTE